MSEIELLARIGRLQIQTEQQDAAYTQLMRLLAAVVKGEIAASRVLVNLTDRTWAVSEPGTGPATPAQFNGLPVCVVGRDEPKPCEPAPPAEVG